MVETKRNAHIIIRFSRWGKGKLNFYPIDAFLAELVWFGSVAIDADSEGMAFLDAHASSRFTQAQAQDLQHALDLIIAKAEKGMPKMHASSPGANEPFRQWAKAQLAPFERLL